MKALDITPQTFKISDFLGWQRDGTLVLSPSFQRRPVWRLGAKSYLIDTILRGLPIPAIMIRERLDLKAQRTHREIVDGQQRLRTVLGFIDSTSIKDFDSLKDSFTVRKNHNLEVAGKKFSAYDDDQQTKVLGYSFVTHVLPPSVEDKDILEMFSRLNATGVRLNHQELRNASFFGFFKDTMYKLALEQLDQWRNWGVFSETQLARMNEVELVSDLMLSAIRGVSGKDHPAIDQLYQEFDEVFPKRSIVEKRFRTIMDLIDKLIGVEMIQTAFKSQVHFWTLFLTLYDFMYGIGSDLNKREPMVLPKNLRRKLLALSNHLIAEDVPEAVLDATRRAPVDKGRRVTRLGFYLAQLQD